MNDVIRPSKERDIAARLRAAHPNSPQYALGSMLLSEAADEIERLRKFIVTRCIGSGGASDAERWHMINEWNKAKAAMSGEQPPRSAHETCDQRGPCCPQTHQPCERMCQSICNRLADCEHEFVAAGPLSETNPRCIKCHRRWSTLKALLVGGDKS